MTTERAPLYNDPNRRRLAGARRGLATLIVLFSMQIIVPDADAVDFVIREKTGVFHFNCVNSCGPARVRKSGKCEYFVQSIYYNGTVKACEPEIAARKACGELEFDEPKRKDLLNPACQ